MQRSTIEMEQSIGAWYSDIKKRLTSKAKDNYLKRLEEIINIVNQPLSEYNTQIIITEKDKYQMWNGIAGDIDTWKGVEITSCTKIKTNYRSYAITSRNWWNRNKAKVFGNHFFYPTIFCYIYDTCMKVKKLSKQEKMYLFVDIFDKILHAKIQFPQTRAQPIIPYQSFIQPNKFKYSSIHLLKQYGIIWNGKNILTNRSATMPTSSLQPQPKQYYIKDKDRSLKVSKSFMGCLGSLKDRLQLALLKSPASASANDNILKIKTSDIIKPIKVKSHPKMIGIPSLNIDSHSNAQNIPLSAVTNVQMARNHTGNHTNVPSPINSNISPDNNINNTMLPPYIDPNTYVVNNGYKGYHGQTNSVINQRYSPLQALPALAALPALPALPSALPASPALPANSNLNVLNLLNNLGNMNDLYCSIRSDSITNKLVLSLHIPLNL